MMPARKPSYIESIPLSHLTVDPTLQRPYDKRRVTELVSKFREEALGVVTVSRRDDGTIHVPDGQTRIGAMRVLGYEDDHLVKCEVWEGLTRAEEAQKFVDLNNTKAVSAMVRFQQRVNAGDETALQLTALLGRHGWRVATGADPGCFNAVTALEALHKATDLACCEQTIATLTAAWGLEPAGTRAELVGGVGAVLGRYRGQVDVGKLLTELRKHEGGPHGLVGRARGLKAIRGGRLADCVAEILIGLHNKRRTNGRLPEWRLDG